MNFVAVLFPFLIYLSVASMEEPSQPIWTFSELLEGILYPRPPDSPGIRQAQSFISNVFSSLQPHWKIETDEFEQLTVLGPKKFTNIIARFRPQCPQFIVIGKIHIISNNFVFNQ